ncbi:type II toxin-antitoxin system PemK/MazF family toxin [Thiomicrospira sp. R3]|uniref:type II toxin-antitoxin system PemK/MazF family toxin n=1 Tax=Thiomicrospira sp. R3 TaxID=3035472 RepID=UPI00259B4455|nr:type II toxin-antitoxin system PemK/MazF family toxin [Thiomicrospira sp. R3]WFE68488.1 type II toxin-antitoxin system PemK/MazF family toxin [Thiomicrospira sp. R3]
MAWCRGDIVLVNFNPTKGQEMNKFCPAIIMSEQQDNEILPTLMVIPLSTQLVDQAMPYRFRIQARADLKQDSDACINEIRALSKERVQQKLGKVSPDEYQQIVAGLCQILVTK